MSEGFVPGTFEDPKYAHVGKAHPAPIWWKCYAREHRESAFTLVAVFSRTWFAARACARVLLGTEEMDGEELDQNERDAMLSSSPEFFIGPHDVVFLDLAPFMTSTLPREIHCTRRAELVNGEFREVATADVENDSEQSAASSPACHCDEVAP
jgi:hypothetical protein